jgi:apolipoprotein N-acyltransferase
MPTLWKKKAVLAIGAGAAMALAMPGFPVGALSLVALVPLLFALEEGNGFFPGVIAGFAFFLVDLRWLFTLTRFTPLVVPGVFLLVLCLSTYFGVFGLIIAYARRRWKADGAFVIVVPVLFTLLEILRNIGPLALGYSSLYQSLYAYPRLIQIVAYLGPWSLTAAIVFVNTALYLALRRCRFGFALLAVGAIAILISISFIPVKTDGSKLDVGIVSSRVPQEEKLDQKSLMPLLNRYLALGRQAAATDPDMIVFPESILPDYILRDDRLLPRFADLARTTGAKILFGTGDYRRGKIYNSVVTLSPGGENMGSYDMVHPFPFGEVIPVRSLWESIGLKRLVDSFLPVELTPGTSHTPVDGIGSPICFESMLPAASRAFAAGGATLLAVVTNDAWFDESSELPAHFAGAVFCAVSTRRYLIQAANMGISGAIDPRGQIMIQTQKEQATSVTVSRLTAKSVYTRFGDIPLYILFVVGLAIAVIMERRNSRVAH